MDETELKKAIEDYFAKNEYKGSGHLRLKRLEDSKINPAFIYAVPTSCDEDIMETDEKWEEGLFELGKRFRVNLKLPYYCYMK